MYPRIITNKTSSYKEVGKVIDSEQFNQIVEAILDGKYSWACVLLLRFSGHNPLHYIPYRTYNRLAKENTQASRQGSRQSTSVEMQYARTVVKTSQTSLSQITDLTHLEVTTEQSIHVKGRGGDQDQLLNEKSQDFSSVKSKLFRFRLKGFPFFN